MKNIAKRIIGKCCHIFHISIARFFNVRGMVLMLHWVGDEVQDKETEHFRVSTEQFKQLLHWLKNRNVIRLETLENEKNFYALTIDDVPENFYYNAYPLLKEADIPFTLFVNISLLDKDGFITKNQLIEMSHCELCTIGSHGINHGEFALLGKQQALDDLIESKEELEGTIGKKVDMFAFPYGSYYACGYRNKHLAKGVYKYAFGTVACPITSPSLLKKYFLPRINVDTKMINSLHI